MQVLCEENSTYTSPTFVPDGKTNLTKAFDFFSSYLTIQCNIAIKRIVLYLAVTLLMIYLISLSPSGH